MIAVEISHDIIGALIGALALVTVAVIPRQVMKANTERRDLLSLRERIDLALRRMDEMQERRAMEHHLLEAQLAEVKQLLLDDLVRGKEKS